MYSLICRFNAGIFVSIIKDLVATIIRNEVRIKKGILIKNLKKLWQDRKA